MILFCDPRPSDGMENPTPHKWVGWGYDTTLCEHCRVDAYQSDAVRTDYCEDVEWAKQEFKALKERRHRATEEAIAVARSALTKEQWELLGLTSKAPYREIDRIIL